MLKFVYAVYDEKAERYFAEHFRISHGDAIRSFGDAVKDSKTSLHAHPSDYSLYCIGEYDDELGSLKSFTPVMLLSRGSEFVNQVPALPVMEEIKQ